MVIHLSNLTRVNLLFPDKAGLLDHVNQTQCEKAVLQ